MFKYDLTLQKVKKGIIRTKAKHVAEKRMGLPMLSKVKLQVPLKRKALNQ